MTTIQTNSFGGRSVSSPIFFHRCRQYGLRLTYSPCGGWNCTTHSSSLQKISLTKHISSHVGHRFRRLTLTCSQPPAQDAINAISFGGLFCLLLTYPAIPSNPIFPMWMRRSLLMSAIFLRVSPSSQSQHCINYQENRTPDRNTGGGAEDNHNGRSYDCIFNTHCGSPFRSKAIRRRCNGA